MDLKEVDANAPCEVVLSAVENSGNALKHASLHLKADEEVVMAAVEQDPSALEYASNILKNDKEIINMVKRLKAGYVANQDNVANTDDLHLNISSS